MNEEQYFERFRKVDAGVKAEVADVAQKIRGLPDGEKVRQGGAVLALACLVEMKLEGLRQKHYQRALEELNEIESSTKQDMNRLGNQRR